MRKFLHRIADQLLNMLVSVILSSVISFIGIRHSSPNYPKSLAVSILLMTMVFMIVFALIHRAVKCKFRIHALDIFVEYTKKDIKITSNYTVSTYNIFQRYMFINHISCWNGKPIFRIRPAKFGSISTEVAKNQYECSVLFPKALSFWNAPIEFRTILIIPINSLPESRYVYKAIYPIDNLTIDVRLKETMCGEMAEGISYHVYESEDLATSEDISYCYGYRYAPKNIHIDQKYIVKWDWSEDAKKLYEQKR